MEVHRRGRWKEVDRGTQAGSRPISGTNEVEVRERVKCKIIRDLCPDADAFPQSCQRCYVFEMYQRIRKEEDDNGK